MRITPSGSDDQLKLSTTHDQQPTPERAATTPSPASPSRFSGVVDRRNGIDRRALEKMRKQLEAEGRIAPSDDAGEPGDSDWQAPSADSGETGLERRRGPGRRRTDFTKSAEEGEMTAEQFLFISAIEAFKKSNAKMFPTWTDVLEVVRLLGYRKTMPSELNLRNAEDWLEKPCTPSGVRSKPGHPEMPRIRREAA